MDDAINDVEMDPEFGPVKCVIFDAGGVLVRCFPFVSRFDSDN